jgi:hypothetical protein
LLPRITPAKSRPPDSWMRLCACPRAW